MNSPIVLLDSGVGGLTVLKSIQELLPDEQYIYLADKRYFPYGTKSFAKIDDRLKLVTNYLLSFDPKAIVIACNTASLHRDTVKNLSKIPVIDVILPTCQVVIEATQNKRVCLLATDATVHSQQYQTILQSNGVEVLPIACSNFVPVAESGQFFSRETMQIVEEKLMPIAHLNFDTVILGCTHFGLLGKAISAVLGERQYIQCGQSTALFLQKTLQDNNLLSNKDNSGIQLISTGKTDSVCDVAQVLKLPFSCVKVVDIH